MIKNFKNLWLFCKGIVFSLMLLKCSALTCDNKGNCKCNAASDDGTYKTVLAKFICDGDPDCDDNSDELNCATRKCKDDEHKCGNGRCIKKKWFCDNYADCKDESDESALRCNFTTCKSDQIRCNNGVCLPNSFKCDRTRDCLHGEDERNCDFYRNCSTSEFQCNNKKCVSKKYVCDGGDDCDDNSDEANCKTCSSNSFACLSGDQCIPKNVKCNGKNDCKDGSDEQSCPTVSTPTCFKNELFCDGECKLVFKCDGENDCDDGADEKNCDAITCAISTEALCDDGKSCVMNYKFCDGKNDCLDGSDEKSSRCDKSKRTDIIKTVSCDADDYQCMNSSSCINSSQLCDKKKDCPLGDDEHSCLRSVSCAAAEYLCRNSSSCINKSQLCDKRKDCPLGEDEQSCLINECDYNNGNCTHNCHDTKISYYCSCKNGFKLSKDNRSCIDINECETFGKCSQTCLNTVGSFKCLCTKGYILSVDERDCIPGTGKRAELVVAVGLDIRSITTDGSHLKRFVEESTKNAVAVDLFLAKRFMFWADAFLKKIFRSNFDTSIAKPLVVATINGLKDLAVDWITGKLYWLSTYLQSSSFDVAELDGSNRKTILILKSNVHSIVLNPLKGYIYWTCITTPKISRANMNGKNIEDVVTNSLIAPTGLTIDYAIEKLFWLDTKKHEIESSDLDGRNRRPLNIGNLQDLFDIAVFGNFIYWTDHIKKTLSAANKFTGQNKSMLIYNEKIPSFVPKRLSVRHSLSQPSGFNPCNKDNGGCSHLCLIVPNGFNCTCPNNGSLLYDGKSCKMPMSVKSTEFASTSTPTSEEYSQSSETTAVHLLYTLGATAGQRKSHKNDSIIQITFIITACVVACLVFFIVAMICYRKKKNANKMEIHYSSGAGDVKIFAPEDRNPTNSKKDAYMKFESKNFEDWTEDEDGDHFDDLQESQREYKTFYRTGDKEGLIAETV